MFNKVHRSVSLKKKNVLGNAIQKQTEQESSQEQARLEKAIT